MEWEGNSLAVQWLGLGAFTARARVQSLVGKLRSCKPRDGPKKMEWEVSILFDIQNIGGFQ